MDTTCTLGYTGWAVSATHSRNPARDSFATEIMTYLDHLYRVAFHLVRNADEAQGLRPRDLHAGVECAGTVLARQQYEGLADANPL